MRRRNTADRQCVVSQPRSRGVVQHLPPIQHVVGAGDVVPLMPLVPDGSLADICHHGLTDYPAGPAEDGVADTVRREELSPGVGVERILVIHQTPGIVEAAQAVRLEGGGDTMALNINSRTQILRTVQTPRHHQLCRGRAIEWTVRVIIGGGR